MLNDPVYIVIKRNDLSSLIDTVNQKIKKGYQCSGGIATYQNPSVVFVQAMTKNEH